MNDGVMLIGGTTPRKENKSYGWFIKLDNHGEIQWEKLSAITGGGFRSIQCMPNQDIVFSTLAPKANALFAGLVFRLNQNGEIVDQYSIPNDAKQAVPILPDSATHLVIRDHNKSTLLTLDEHFKQIGKISGDIPLIYSNRTYLLPDRSLVLFGRQGRNGVYYAALQWVSADLKQQETIILQPELSSFEVTDALPTGEPGEFAFIRDIYPHSGLLGRRESRQGVILGFVKIKN